MREVERTMGKRERARKEKGDALVEFMHTRAQENEARHFWPHMTCKVKDRERNKRDKEGERESSREGVRAYAMEIVFHHERERE